jgi:DNA-binding GntR family transcriptional regulator
MPMRATGPTSAAAAIVGPGGRFTDAPRVEGEGEFVAAPNPEGAPRPDTVAAAVATLRRQVLHCELMPGQQIRQDVMAAALGVSRVPLREALRVLAGEGLLVHRPNQGYFVAKLSADEFRQIVFLLEYLETELIRTLRWPTEDELAELRALNAQVLEAARSPDLATVTDLNRRLHFRVFRLSPQELLLAETERYWVLAQPYRLLHVASSDMERSAHQHDELIDALAARNRGLCLRITSDHRRATMTVAMGMIGTSTHQSRSAAG